MYPYLKIISLLFHSPLIPCFQVLFKNLLNLITIVFANHSLFYLKKFFFFDQRGKNDSLGILTIHLLRLAYIQSYIYSLGDSHWAKSKGTIKGQEQITLFAIIKDAFSFLFTCIFSSFLPSSSFTFHCLINLLSSLITPPHLKKTFALFCLIHLTGSIRHFFQVLAESCRVMIGSIWWGLYVFWGILEEKRYSLYPGTYKAHLRPFQKMFLPLFAFYVFYLIFLETGAFSTGLSAFSPQSARQLYSKTFLLFLKNHAKKPRDVSNANCTRSPRHPFFAAFQGAAKSSIIWGSSTTAWSKAMGFEASEISVYLSVLFFSAACTRASYLSESVSSPVKWGYSSAYFVKLLGRWNEISVNSQSGTSGV